MKILKFVMGAIIAYVVTICVAGTTVYLMDVFADYLYHKNDPPATMLSFHSVGAKDYQLDIHMDTTWLYDGDRLVGKVIDTNWNSPLHQLIAEDNQ